MGEAAYLLTRRYQTNIRGTDSRVAVNQHIFTSAGPDPYPPQDCLDLRPSTESRRFGPAHPVPENPNVFVPLVQNQYIT